MRIKRYLYIFSLFFLCWCTNSSAWEPAKDINLIVPYKQGSGIDTCARMISSFSERFFKHKLLIKNSARGKVGWDEIIKAAPDGYTIGFISLPSFSTYILNSHMDMTDIEPICNHVTEPSIVIVNADSPYNTIKDLVDDAKVRGNILAAINGFMASNHIAAQLLANSGGFDYIAVDCGGTSDQLLALLNDEVQFSCVKLPDITPLLKKEQPEVRILATFSTVRLNACPEVPTLSECGYYNKWYGSSRGLVAPKGTPKEVIDYYVKTFREMLTDPEVIAAHNNSNLTMDFKDNLNFDKTLSESFIFSKDIIPEIYKGKKLDYQN